MNPLTVDIVIASVTATVFFIAIGIDGWDCGGSILSDACLTFKVNEVTGVLLLTSAILVILCAIFRIQLMFLNAVWADIVSCVTANLAAILSFAGIVYYLDTRQWWSPFLATVAVSFTILLAVQITADLFENRCE